MPDPIAVGIDAAGPGLAWLRPIVKIGAIAGLRSVMLVMLLGQPRIFYSMSKDGLLPPVFGKVHPKFRTPYLTTILTGVVGDGRSPGCFPIGLLGELVSIGTLLAFVIVCAGVLVLRYTDPDRPRPFRTPLVPFVPIARHPGLLLPDGRPAGRHLGPAVVWMAHRAGDLLPVRAAAFEGAGEGVGGRRRRRRAREQATPGRERSGAASPAYARRLARSRLRALRLLASAASAVRVTIPSCRSPSPPTGPPRRGPWPRRSCPGQRVCLTTHVNPDGDGLGSEAGLAHLLRDRGHRRGHHQPDADARRGSSSCSRTCPGSTAPREAIRGAPPRRR